MNLSRRTAHQLKVINVAEFTNVGLKEAKIVMVTEVEQHHPQTGETITFRQPTIRIQGLTRITTDNERTRHSTEKREPGSHNLGRNANPFGQNINGLPRNAIKAFLNVTHYTAEPMVTSERSFNSRLDRKSQVITSAPNQKAKSREVCSSFKLFQQTTSS